MRKRLRVITAAALALCLQACITGQPPAASAPASYFWLPLLGVSDDGAMRTRVLIDAMLMQRGHVHGNALALSISAEGERRGDGSLGLGSYAGGYAYYAPAPAPPGAIVIQAFDARTLRPVWRATLPHTHDDAELRRALTDALASFPSPGVAGHRSRVEPDARAAGHEAIIAAGREAILPITAERDCCGWEADAAD